MYWSASKLQKTMVSLWCHVSFYNDDQWTPQRMNQSTSMGCFGELWNPPTGGQPNTNVVLINTSTVRWLMLKWENHRLNRTKIATALMLTPSGRQQSSSLASHLCPRAGRPPSQPLGRAPACSQVTLQVKMFFCITGTYKQLSHKQFGEGNGGRGVLLW